MVKKNYDLWPLYLMFGGMTILCVATGTAVLVNDYRLHNKRNEVLQNAKPVTVKVTEMRDNKVTERIDTVAIEIPYKPELKQYLPK